MPVSLQCRRINISTMFATLRCSRAAASRTASLTPGSMRRFNVDTLVLAMRYIVYQLKRKCNALCDQVATRSECAIQGGLYCACPDLSCGLQGEVSNGTN